MTLSVQNAIGIITELEKRELTLGKNSPQQIQDHLKHIYGTAYIAKKIALQIPEMNPDKIYVAALLHDIGRLEENRAQRFHGIIGYEKLKGKDENAARIALIHMFPWNKLPDFEQCSGWFFGNRPDYETASSYLAQTSTQEQDLLVQLADSLANKNGFVTLKERVKEYEKRHGEALSQKQIILRYRLKSYFDKKIGHSVYDLFPKPAEKELPCLLTDQDERI